MTLVRNKDFLDVYLHQLRNCYFYLPVHSGVLREILISLPIPIATINDSFTSETPILFCMEIPGKGTCLIVSDKVPEGWDLLTADELAVGDI